MDRRKVTIDGNQAAAHVAHKVSEVIAIYPITPSSPMGEWPDQWSAMLEKNIWGTIPQVTEMQSEGGASGAVHGALQAGALTTTFTASQGLLLMIPNMFKIAGELTATVFHVSARTVATHALSIFGDHSDVMATRSTGFAQLASNSVQEIMDFALIATAATLKARIPFIHFFDGFRSSHEVQKIEELTLDDMRAMLPYDLVLAHRKRGLSPDHPFIRGTAQNPDVFFQGREAINKFYHVCPGIVQETMDAFAKITGRQYHLFDYVGDPRAERVIVMMGSGAEAAEETLDYLNAKGEKLGLLKVRLYRPFDGARFVAALPKSVKKIAVLDRTKEAGAGGEPLYLDCVNAISEANADGKLGFELPRIVGGRYGLSSKEFTPGMVKAVYDNLSQAKPKNHFTVGIRDDVTHLSLEFDPNFVTEPADVIRGLFYGLGADGTVGANKNSIKIIGEETDNYAQGYFVYDSKKSGAITVSHLRFGPRPIRSSYLVTSANFIACHQWSFLEKYDMLKDAVNGGTFLLNSPYGPDEVWDRLPRKVQEDIIAKHLKLYVIDGYEVGKKTGMGARINTIMQTCFFAISGVLPRDEAIGKIKEAIKKTYSRKGDEVVKKNYEAVDGTLANLFQVKVPALASSRIEMPPTVTSEAPSMVQEVIAEIMAGRGDNLPVSCMPADGTWPSGTTKWEKRNVALEIPVWDENLCIQCGKCSMICPHAAIRYKIYEASDLEGKPASFKVADAIGKVFKGRKFTIQTAPEDCTGCGLCVHICPSVDKQNEKHRAIDMAPQMPLRAQEQKNFEYFLRLPEFDRTQVKPTNVKDVGLLEPLFEFSGACSGCGETPYVVTMSRLFGDRAYIANATGCSSIYGGNLPTTPWTTNRDGRGPAWSNSLFEDNAEFGLGFRLAVDKFAEFAGELVLKLKDKVGAELAEELLRADQSTELGIGQQRMRVVELRNKLASLNGDADARQLASLADYLVKKSVWILGGDGWAYDIGYGGLDHVLASGRNVNVLVLDTEVYSNTGGQASKSTPRGAVAQFAAAGKPCAKKDLAQIIMTYRSVYIAAVASGANEVQTLRAFTEAEAYNGPSLIVAYSPCLAHGINMGEQTNSQELAVKSGHWPLFRYNPDLLAQGKNPLKLDSKPPQIDYEDFAYSQVRFKGLATTKPEEAAQLMKMAKRDVKTRWRMLEQMAALDYSDFKID